MTGGGEIGSCRAARSRALFSLLIDCLAFKKSKKGNFRGSHKGFKEGRLKPVGTVTHKQ